MILWQSRKNDLGVLIDSYLNFENHILSKVKTCNRIIGLIRRNFKNMDFPDFLLWYKSLIRSHLEYARTVWSPFRSKLIEAVEKVQRRATKILPELSQFSYTQRLQKLDLPTLVYRRARGRSIQDSFMVIIILKVFLSYSQVHIVTPEAITKSSSSYRLIWICENIFLLSE